MTRPFDDLTLEMVATFPRPGATGPGRIGFTPDSRHVTFLESREGTLVRSLFALDVRTGERHLLAAAPPETAGAAHLSREEALRRERARLRETGITAYQFARGASPLVLLVPIAGRLFIRIGEGPLTEILGTEGALDACLSRDGRRVAYVRNDDLYTMSLPSGSPERLTFDGGEGVTNGVAEYVAHEEFGRNRGFWWNRDGSRLAFVRADSRHIPWFPIVHQGKRDVDVERHRYPFAGAANAKVQVGVVSSTGAPPMFLDLPEEEDPYIARVAWRPAGDLAVLLLSRDQRTMRWYRFDPQTGQRDLLCHEEGVPWLNISSDTRFLDSGEMLTSSERTGFRQLYLDEEPLTQGDDPVISLLDVDEDRRLAYYVVAGNRARERHICCVSLDGGATRRLTNGAGWHEGVFSPDHRLFAHTASSLESPPRVTLETTEGEELLVLHEDPTPTARALGLSPPRMTEVRTEDGTILNACLYEPPPGGGRHPVIVSVYGGPHAQRVADEWSLTVDLRAQYLARQGYLVLKLDNRGSANRGLGFEAPIYRRMGSIEVEDQVAGILALGERSDVDLSRVGVYGWSYGGYMTLLLLMKRPDVFHVGVAGAPVTDWDGYDTGYTERYMETPVRNPDGYRESSALTHVGKLEGNLLLVHGMVDENVHFRHSARLLTKLQKAGKTAELLALPEERHMPRDRAGLLYLENTIAEFFGRHLHEPAKA